MNERVTAAVERTAPDENYCAVLELAVAASEPRDAAEGRTDETLAGLAASAGSAHDDSLHSAHP